MKNNMPINEAEKKLAEYRAKKNREALINHYKAEVKSMFSKFVKKKDDKNEKRETEEEEINSNLLETSTTSQAESYEEYASDVEENASLTVFDYVQYTLWFILWITIYAIFIKLEFGTIYLIVSGIAGMYLNTRTRPKKKNEISAYSVFNKNCESIDGTLTADQLTKQMLYGGFAR